MKRLLVAIVLLLLVVLYFFEKDEETLVVESNSSRVMEENQTRISPPKVKEVLVVESNKSEVKKEKEEEEESNTTTVPKLCLKYKTEYDSRDKYETDKLGRVKSITYDANGDGEVESKEFRSYDEFGNLVKVVTEIYQEREKLYGVEGLGETYYTSGEYKSIPIKKIEVSNSYDSQNRLTEKLIEYPTYSKQFIYEYDDQIEPIFVQIFINDELSVKFKGMHEYDERGRLIHQKYKAIEASEKIIWMGWDNPELHEKKYVYNDKNQVTRMEDPEYYRFVEYAYDEQGNKIQEKIYRKRGGNVKRYGNILYKYDKYGNLLEKVDKDCTITIGYDKDGNSFEEINPNGTILFKQEFGACEE